MKKSAEFLPPIKIQLLRMNLAHSNAMILMNQKLKKFFGLKRTLKNFFKILRLGLGIEYFSKI